MRKFVIIISKLKYLGLLGLPMFFSDMVIWNYLWLFWLIGILEIAFIFPVFVQSLQQIAGLVYIAVKYNPAPDKDNHTPQVLYSLPFEGAWVAVNGGVIKETSHSWDMTPQRYAYDFIILADCDVRQYRQHIRAAFTYSDSEWEKFFCIGGLANTFSKYSGRTIPKLCFV